MAFGARQSEEASSPVIGRLLTRVMLVLWCTYSLNGFRGWWVPIELSDADAGSGVRQLLFASLGVCSLVILWLRGVVWETIRAQRFTLILGVLMGLSILYSDLPALTAKRTILFGCGMLTAWAYVACSQHPIRSLHRDLLLILTAVALSSILWRFAFPMEITTNPGRPGLAGISNHPNTLAPALALGLVLGMSLSPRSRIDHTTRLISVLACGSGLLMTGSVTSLLLAAFCLVVFVAQVSSAYWNTLSAGALAALGLGIAVLGPKRVADGALGGMGRDSSMSGRDELWRAMLEKASEAPLLGHGWGAFWTEGKGRTIVSTWNPRQSHNAYIDIAVDLGLVGLAFVVLMVVPAIAGAAQDAYGEGTDSLRRERSGLLACVWGLLFVYAMQQSFLGKPDSFAFIFLLVAVTGFYTTSSHHAATKKTPAPS